MAFYEDDYTGDEICDLFDDGAVVECNIHHRLVWCENVVFAPRLDGFDGDVVICREFCERSGARQLVESARSRHVPSEAIRAKIERSRADGLIDDDFAALLVENLEFGPQW